jgi:hypothetical protein
MKFENTELVASFRMKFSNKHLHVAQIDFNLCSHSCYFWNTFLCCINKTSIMIYPLQIALLSMKPNQISWQGRGKPCHIKNLHINTHSV